LKTPAVTALENCNDEPAPCAETTLKPALVQIFRSLSAGAPDPVIDSYQCGVRLAPVAFIVPEPLRAGDDFSRTC
jgi:hypothetical protein